MHEGHQKHIRILIELRFFKGGLNLWVQRNAQKKIKMSFWLSVKSWMIFYVSRRFFGHNVQGSLSLNMGIKILNFSTPKPHNGSGGILLKEF